MTKIPFEDGVKVSDAKVTIGGEDYTVTPAVYTGTTPMSAYNLNQMQDNIESALSNSASYSSDEKVIGTWTNR